MENIKDNEKRETTVLVDGDTETIYNNMTKEEVKKLREDEAFLKKENERRETLRHKVVADFVTMCAEFLYNEFLKKLKEQEQKDSFFASIKE